MAAKRMTVDLARNVVQRLAVFARLERKATDEAGWIALAYSVSRPVASRMIEDARRLLEAK